MNKLFLPLAAALLLALPACQKETGIAEIETAFTQTPPPSAYPWVWWHWMDGNISREGIRKDLLWMKEMGIAGLHQFDAGGRPIPQIVTERVPYLSDTWKEAFRYALHLTDSLGIEVAVASSPGWSSTGGPWVPRENAMKKLVWRTVEVTGKAQEITLPKPFDTVGKYQDVPFGEAADIDPWYEDVAVVAVRLPDADRSLQELGATVRSSEGRFTVDMLTDGLLAEGITLAAQKPAWVQYEFPEPQTFQGVLVSTERLRSRYGSVPGGIRLFLECSDDGKNYREAARIPDNVVFSITVDFPPQTARFWRLRINPAANYPQGQCLREFVLYPTVRVNHAEEKGAFAAQHDFMQFPTPDSPDAIRDVVVIEAPIREGKVACSLPEGRWRVFRFGQTLTGKKNHPAAPDATGLEVDKLDPDAWMDHFHQYLNLYQEAAGGMMGQKGIQYLLTDSYEAEQMTWTRHMREEFLRRNGYDVLRWLPALTGEVLDSSVETEKFLWDWRNTIGDLFAENYDRLEFLIQEYGMRGRYTESHENGRVYVGDGMDIKMHATVPMSAIWMPDSPSGSKIPMACADIKESSSVAHIFGQNIAAAESFTANGYKGRAYTYCPENIKWTADLALSHGLNRFVVHDSAHQPSDDHLPGTGLFQYGQWFNRHETWAPMARAWTDYLARSCYLLQQGTFVADILWYYGEDNCVCGLYGLQFPAVPEGYAFDFINPKGLLEAVHPEKGTLRTASGMHYRVLALGDNCRRMSVKMLRRIVEIARAGVPVCGVLPEECVSLTDDVREFDALRAELQALRVSADLAGALEAKGIGPDLVSTVPGLSYVHRSLHDADIFWVRNFSGKPVTAGLTLRIPKTGTVEVWNPENGSVTPLLFTTADAGVSATLDMDEHAALFLVARRDGVQDKTIITPQYQESQVLDGPWKVTFQEGRGAPEEATFASLIDWTTHSDEGIRYYSGIATYTTTFYVDHPADITLLGLGSVKNMAAVSINGTSCGTAWKAPWQVQIPDGVLREGENVLTVRVANLWVNRIIGDRRQQTRFTSTPNPFYSADDALLPSGLLGPVILFQENKRIFVRK